MEENPAVGMVTSSVAVPDMFIGQSACLGAKEQRDMVFPADRDQFQGKLPGIFHELAV